LLGACGTRPACACFAALARLVAHGADYEREFGTAAQVRASLHCGSVVVGEMGSVKKEIALSGDTLNTAARLVDVCRDSDGIGPSPRPTFSTGSCFLLTLQRGHWASSGYAARNRPSGFARWPRRRLIHASRRYEKMGTHARRLRPGQITPSQIICFQVPGGATLGPVHKCPQFHNLGIEALWFETAVLALPPAKALPRTG
jgi:hypothetical protein